MTGFETKSGPFEDLLYTKNDGIATVTINRPTAMNAYTTRTLREMTEALRDASWDDSIGVLCDFGGDDQYLSTGRTTQGRGEQAGLGILFDYNGNDLYQNSSQGYASSSISYHSMPQCGGNFSFVVDYGGRRDKDPTTGE